MNINTNNKNNLSRQKIMKKKNGENNSTLKYLLKEGCFRS